MLSLSLFKYFFHAYFAIFECSQGRRGGGFMPIPCVSHHTPTSLFGNILPFVHEAFCESAWCNSSLTVIYISMHVGLCKTLLIVIFHVLCNEYCWCCMLWKHKLWSCKGLMFDKITVQYWLTVKIWQETITVTLNYLFIFVVCEYGSSLSMLILSIIMERSSWFGKHVNFSNRSKWLMFRNFVQPSVHFWRLFFLS